MGSKYESKKNVSLAKNFICKYLDRICLQICSAIRHLAAVSYFATWHSRCFTLQDRVFFYSKGVVHKLCFTRGGG